jgi:hypothetical protein
MPEVRVVGVQTNTDMGVNKMTKKLTKSDYIFPKLLTDRDVGAFMGMTDDNDRREFMRLAGIKLKNPEPVPKVKPESNDSVTVAYLTDGCGKPRKLNIHAYRIANTQSSAILLTIINDKDKPLASVILHPGSGDLLPLFQQIDMIL